MTSRSSVSFRAIWLLVTACIITLVPATAWLQEQAPAAAAQQGEPISPSVVLVLKLVSSTLVKPTTGIVISADGMVLVPAGFAAEAGEMIVLDGGTDISSNGRPAKLVAGAGADGLAVLSVKGLKRPGIKLSGNRLDADGILRLEAFPPAEQIAKGLARIFPGLMNRITDRMVADAMRRHGG